jgi:hypothetical protein
MLNLIRIDKRVVEVSTLEVEISTVLRDNNVGSMERKNGPSNGVLSLGPGAPRLGGMRSNSTLTAG